VRGFRLSTNQAFELLRRKYNPRCQPAWSEKELWHKVEDAEISGKLPLGYLLDAPLSKASAGRSQRVSTPSVPFVPPVGLVTKIQAAQIAGRCKRTIRRWVTSGFLRDARSDGDQLSHLVIDRSELEAYLEGVDKEVFSPLDNALLDPPDALSTPLAKQCHPPARLPLDIHISGDLPLAPAAPLASLARTGPPESRARVNSRVLLAGAHYA